MKHVKKVTKKDRYGNTISYEFESPVKPIDQTKLMEKMIDGMPDIPEMATPDHPGEPRGTDTVPAWLTPGEFVVNKEATDIYGPQIEAMNDHGRELQAAKGMEVPGYDIGGKVSKLYNEGYTAPGQAYAIAKDMGYNKGGEVPLWAKVYSKVTGVGEKRPESKPKITKLTPAQLKAKEEKHSIFKADGGWITDKLLDKLREVESGGDNEAVSKAGAIGEYQWLPSSAKKAGYGIKPFDPKDPKAARAATKQYLKNMQEYHGFTPEETLRAYNWGPGNVINYRSGKREDIPAEALNYPGKILGFENVEGVDVRGDMPLPTPRPNTEVSQRPDALDMPIEVASGESDHVKDFLSKYMYDGGNVPHFDTIANQYNTYKPIADSIALEGEEDVDYTDIPLTEVTSNQNPMYEGTDTTPEVDAPWYNALLGHKTKAPGTLSENEKRLADQATSDSELLASNQLAEEENQIAADAPMQSVEDDIIGGSGTVGNVGQGPQVDDIDPKDFKNEVKNKTIDKINEQTKDADPVVENENEVIAKGEADPDMVKKATGFLKNTLGDLFDTKELTRMAVMYAGSRLLGYNHQGSLRFAAKNYIQRVDQKVANRDEFIKTNAKNYTPASLAQYKKTGDLSVLKKLGDPVNRTGQYKTFYGPQGAVKAEQIKVGKNTYWSTDGGKTAIDGTKFNEDPAYIKGTKENKTMVNNFISRTTDQLKSLRNQFDRYEDGDNVGYNTDINPATSSGKIAEWAVKNGVKPEELSGLVESAYHDAINDRRQDGSRARNLVPYLNQLIIRQKVGNPDIFLAKGYDPDDKGAKQYVNAQKLQSLNNSVAHVMKAKGLQGGTKDLSNQFYNAALRDWNKLTTKEQESYIGKALDDESGFYKFVEEQALKFAQ